MARTNSKKSRAARKNEAEVAEARARLLEAHSKPCPKCDQANTAVIYCGHWFNDNQQVTEDIEAGLVIPGEFTLDPNAPDFHCNICRHEW
jgi:hypothetical protein